MSQHTPTGPAGPASGQPYPAPVPPQRRSWFARHKVLTALGAFVVLVVAAALASQGGNAADDALPSGDPTAAGQATQQTTEPAAEQTTEPTEEPTPDTAPAAAIGTPVRDGKFEFTVTQVETGVTRLGDDLFGLDAQGQFVLLHVTVTNVGTEAQYFDGSGQKLLDSAGRTFSADSTAAIYLDQSNSFLNQINPGNTVEGVVVFDVPTDASLASAELHDSVFSGGVTVALG